MQAKCRPNLPPHSGRTMPLGYGNPLEVGDRIITQTGHVTVMEISEDGTKAEVKTAAGSRFWLKLPDTMAVLD